MLCRRGCKLFGAALVLWTALLISRAGAAENGPLPAERGATAVPRDDRHVTDDLVQAALTAEIEGRDADRISLLQKALAATPDDPRAHWHAGYVLIDGQWLALPEIADRAPRAEVLQAYHQRAHRAGPTVKEQLKLANWCREAGLKSHERKHLAQAQALKPGLPEVVERLNLRKHQGVWLPAEVVQRRVQAAREMAAWDLLVVRIRDDLASRDSLRRESALQHLDLIDDPRAAASLESKLSGESREAALASVSVLARLPQPQATNSLVRLAVLSQWAEARDAAAQALRSRSLFSYAPMLLAGLQAPVEVHVYAYGRHGGSATHRLELFQEGPLQDRSIVATTHIRPEIGSEANSISASRAQTAPLGGADVVSSVSMSESLPVAFRSLDGAARDTATIAQRVERANAATRELNDRIARALNTATGQTRSAEPRAWWKWWCDYNELYVPPRKPVQEQTYDHVVKYPTRLSVGAPQAAGTTVQLPIISCFLAGTKVWTQQGTRAIETIQVGDDVLAQDVETGELAFKPVLATTVRPPSPILTVNLGNEVVGVTRGHPLWVVGQGWRMAKELSVGQRLHTIDGAAAIEGIDKTPDAEAFNLVVADFHTYFIGDRKVLVHDNNIREATSALLPGCLPESETAHRGTTRE